MIDAFAGELKTHAIRVTVLAVLVAFSMIAGPLLTLATGTSQGLILGIVVIVMLGAGGQVLRGIGELRSSPMLKASGYFLGAAAYVVTASVALTNAAHLLPNR